MQRGGFVRSVMMVTSALHAVFDHRRRPASKIAEFRLRSGETGQDVSIGRWKVDHYDGTRNIAACYADVEAELIKMLDALGEGAGRMKVYFWSADGEHDEMIWDHGPVPSSLAACRRRAEKEVSAVVRDVRAGAGRAGVEARIVARLQASVEEDLQPPRVERLHKLTGGGASFAPGSAGEDDRLRSLIANRTGRDVLTNIVRLPRAFTVLEQSFASTGVAPRAERRGGGASTNKKPFCGVVVLLIGSAGEGDAAVDLLIERLKKSHYQECLEPEVGCMWSTYNVNTKCARSRINK